MTGTDLRAVCIHAVSVHNPRVPNLFFFEALIAISLLTLLVAAFFFKL